MHAPTQGARVWVKGGDYFYFILFYVCLSAPSTEYPKEAPSPSGCLFWAAFSCSSRAFEEVPEQNYDTNEAIKKSERAFKIQGDCSRHFFQIVSQEINHSTVPTHFGASKMMHDAPWKHYKH